MSFFTSSKVRRLDSAALGVSLPVTPAAPAGLLTPGQSAPAMPPLVAPLIDPADPILLTVKDLLTTYGGVLFSGPPGTSKSYYAEQIALSLSGDPKRVRTVQFHPSYQYEDFMEGYLVSTGRCVARTLVGLTCRSNSCVDVA